MGKVAASQVPVQPSSSPGLESLPAQLEQGAGEAARNKPLTSNLATMLQLALHPQDKSHFPSSRASITSLLRLFHHPTGFTLHFPQSQPMFLIAQPHCTSIPEDQGEQSVPCVQSSHHPDPLSKDRAWGFWGCQAELLCLPQITSGCSYGQVPHTPRAGVPLQPPTTHTPHFLGLLQTLPCWFKSSLYFWKRNRSALSVHYLPIFSWN